MKLPARTIDDRAKLAAEIKSCDLCELRNQCRRPVPFTGPVPATIAIVGEAPGRDEDRVGEPFVGPAGKLLWGELRRHRIDRSDVFVCNTVSCYPGSIRNPEEEHVEACWVNLLAQLKMADPDWILVLGRVALSNFMPGAKISAYRGTDWVIPTAGRQRNIFIAYHPSYILRNRSRRSIWQSDLADFATKVDHG